MSRPRAAIFGCAGLALSADEKAFFRDADPLGFILFARNIDTPAPLPGPDGEPPSDEGHRTRTGPAMEVVFAGREGELIFRYIYEAAGCEKPFSRLWISSLTPEAIRKGGVIARRTMFKVTMRDTTIAHDLQSQFKASRVLMRIAHTSYTNENDIYDLALAAPWENWFGVEHTLRVDVTAIKSPLKSLLIRTYSLATIKKL